MPARDSLFDCSGKGRALLLLLNASRPTMRQDQFISVAENQMNQTAIYARRGGCLALDVLRRAGSPGAVIILLLLTSCSTVRVKLNPDQVTRDGIQSANLLRQVAGVPVSVISTFAEGSANLLKHARDLEFKGSREDSAAAYMKAAIDARELLVSNSEARGSEAEKAIVKVHNSALARFAELWIKDPRGFEPGPYRLSRGSENLEIELSKESSYQRGYFDRFIAAEAVDGKGLVHKHRDGYGATIVAIRDQLPERAGEMRFYPDRGLHQPVTVTMDSVIKSGETTRVTLSIRNPLVQETAPVGNRSLPLATDYSAPLAMLLKGRNEVLSGLAGFFEADERIETSGLFLMESYDPTRIPVILIHGLISVPIIWRDIIPEMIADPEISKRYQFMVFTYPSSFPLIESAALLRDQLGALRAKYDPDGKDPLSRNIVVVGHSMGGMLAHSLVTDFGDNLWKQFSDSPLESLSVPETTREGIRRLVYFDMDPAVRRAVYFSTPHRGSEMAEKSLAGIVSRVVKLPHNVLRVTGSLFDPGLSSGLHLKSSVDKKVTSIQSLQPGADMVVAMDASPHKEGVVHHSIVGDRGKGDTPESSDGIVDYWSSHLENADSELIVPTGHKSYKHPRAIAELRRILYLHAGL